jgi:hypothetical protein
MSSKKPDAKAFLAAMSSRADAEDEPVRGAAVSATTPAASPATVHELPPAAQAKPASRARAVAKKAGRAQLKHFGGYLDDDTLEKIALLRVRLKKDNSELIKFAIEELHRKHNAKRAFGDV